MIDASAIMNRKARRMVKALQSIYPDLQIGCTDFGCTIRVRLPGVMFAHCVCRVFHRERDGFIGAMVLSASGFRRLRQVLAEEHAA